MNRLIILILTIFTSGLLLKADPNWRIHTTFDEEVSRVVETPNYVYFTSRNLEENGFTETFFSLFR